MTLRLLLAIGCNDYADQNSFLPLQGAEKDATEVYQALLGAGDYDANASRLLLSPNFESTQSALRSMLFDAGPIDTLTVFFAGHGTLKKESYYLCVSDSSYGALSATAVSLSNLLQMIAEAGPIQANVIVDACNSGGVAGDLNAILKHDVLGKDGSPSVTLVASAASDQDALETMAGGVATRALLACITGTLFVQNSAPALDLIDVGRAIGVEVASRGLQTPFVWGLNLFGGARFCKNPHHSASSNASLHQVGSGVSGLQADAIRAALPKLYRLYEGAPQKLSLSELYEIVRSVVVADPSQIASSATFVARLQAALREQLKAHADRFAAIEASVVCLLPLARAASTSVAASRFVERCVAAVMQDAEAVLADVVAAAEADKFALLSKSGLADLFYLPVRLTKVLGWASAVFLVRRSLGEDTDSARSLLVRLSEVVTKDYSTSLKAMSDLQSPYVAATLAAFRDAGLEENGEVLLSLLFNSVLKCSGNLARNDLEPPEILEYLKLRGIGAWDSQHSLLATPSELVLVILAFAPSFSLSEEFDVQLRSLDHVLLNAFVPDQWEDAAAENISAGVNHTMQIGRHFFTVADVVSRLEGVAVGVPPARSIAGLVLLASFVFPDRTAWYLWSPPVKSLAEAAA